MAELFYRKRGETGEPVIVLHGLFGSNDNQGGVMRALQDDYRVYGVDLRNHGKSEHVDTMGYDAMAEDVIGVMDKEGLEQVHLVGHSMGGKTSMQIALNYPDRVKSLCVLDIAPVQYAHFHRDIIKGLRKVSEMDLSGRAEVMEHLSAYESEPAIVSFLATNWRRDESGKWKSRLNLDAIERDYALIIAGNDGPTYHGPIMFIRGGNSDYILPKYREEILNLFPNAQVRTIEGTGHWLHAEKPELVQNTIKRFLDQQ